MQAIDLGSQFLQASHHNGVLRVQLNRPERRNACTLEMYNGIKRATLIAEQDRSIDVLVITGTDDTFCVGGDMAKHFEHDKEYALEEQDVTLAVPFAYLERCSKIVIAEVNGLCHAGGLDMMMCADIAVASDRALFRAPELLRGIADGWLGARLPHRIGFARAKHMIFTGATLDADQAERIGLVSQVVAHEQLAQTVEQMIEQIKLTGPKARAMLKKQMNQELPDFDIEIFLRSTQSEEVLEGINAFIEKRSPVWPR